MIVASALATSAATPALAQPASAALARELTSTLAARHLDAFAARDPQAPSRILRVLIDALRTMPADTAVAEVH